jgi:hypothetical protein
VLRKHVEIGDVRKKVFSPALTFLRLARATEKPGTEGEMPRAIIGDHMWFDHSESRRLVATVVKLHDIS